MKKILIFISLLSITFTQELKFEENLNDTGAVINDSLAQVIVGQQTQITAQQQLITSLETKEKNDSIDLFGKQISKLQNRHCIKPLLARVRKLYKNKFPSNQTFQNLNS